MLQLNFTIKSLGQYTRSAQDDYQGFANQTLQKYNLDAMGCDSDAETIFYLM